jgi:hypothetical protein
MKTVTVVYHTTLYFQQDVQVPDDFDEDNDEHYQELLNKLSFVDELDSYSEITDIRDARGQ